MTDWLNRDVVKSSRNARDPESRNREARQVGRCVYVVADNLVGDAGRTRNRLNILQRFSVSNYPPGDPRV